MPKFESIADMLLCVSVDDAVAPQWEEVLDALDAISPLIDDVGPGLAFADMRGIAGTPAEWMRAARSAIEPFTMVARLGAGKNKTCARAAAHLADGTVCPPGREREFLAPLDLQILEIEPAVCNRLRLLGIDCVGDLARLPHGPFVRRFGSQAARWHACARGEDPAPFVPRGHAVAIEASVFGEGRTEDEAQVIFALRVLLSRICADLERCGKRAGSLQIDVELEDAHTRQIDVLLASPTGNDRSMLDVIRAKLEGITFEAPIVGLRVRAGRLEEGGESLPLFSGSDFDPQAVAVAIARLEAMLGEPVRQARTHAAHVLEDRFSYEPFVPPRQAPIERSGERAEKRSSGDGAVLVPQLRLLAVREVRVRLRDGEPATLAIAGDDRPPRAVVKTSGPWRVEVGWFSGAPVARDEYDVLVEDGALYRIYRQGTQWYLRGAYD